MSSEKPIMIYTEPHAPNLIATLTELYGPKIEFGELPKEPQLTHYPEGGEFCHEYDFPVLHNGERIGTYIVSLRENGEEVVAKQYHSIGRIPNIDSSLPPRLIWTPKDGRRDRWPIDFP